MCTIRALDAAARSLPPLTKAFPGWLRSRRGPWQGSARRLFLSTNRSSPTPLRLSLAFLKPRWEFRGKAPRGCWRLTSHDQALWRLRRRADCCASKGFRFSLSQGEHVPLQGPRLQGAGSRGGPSPGPRPRAGTTPSPAQGLTAPTAGSPDSRAPRAQMRARARAHTHTHGYTNHGQAGCARVWWTH